MQSYAITALLKILLSSDLAIFGSEVFKAPLAFKSKPITSFLRLTDGGGSFFNPALIQPKYATT
jgi:hypothetical protein